ncbi:helix-turn-helix protein [Pontibacter ummariensis]|uniref:Helix-turn-helix n=1 Tax=Pontibacter ummariensis TaxID=1610492 RepID=A0A239J0D9_9BACT|nr:helix-turn-helix transcriptional regulator [Pontibacter ummariensis]PRY09056.1 helix-turn-helix protein [Pontibacter ummariensis]SNS99337.1 Helix-turn-helix [Pontibacter ummariensis]
MKIALSDIGEKLSSFRKTLNLSQKEVAVAMGVHQTQISKIENGEGGSIELLLLVLNYYGNNYNVKFVLGDEFEVIVNSPGDSLTSPYNKIAVEKLTMLEGEISSQLADIRKLLSSSS